MTDNDYLAWRAAIDQEMRRRTGGFSAADFPDFEFRAAFGDEMKPAEVVDEILAREGWR
jgi:hypothetical protein